MNTSFGDAAITKALVRNLPATLWVVAQVQDCVEERLCYTDVLSVPAHTELGAGYSRIIPDHDRAFTAHRAGYYRFMVRDMDGNDLMWINLPPLTEGSSVSSMALRIGATDG